MKLLILNGPNINLLGIREPDIYGNETYEQLCGRIQAYADQKGVSLRLVQSNHEGALVDAIQAAYFDGFDGIVINPAAYTHTSIALLDAIKGVGLPCVEVHISDPETREDFRKISYVRSACIDTVKGQGTKGYLVAIDRLIALLEDMV